MPDRITLDDALELSHKTDRITIDEALNQRVGQSRPIGGSTGRESYDNYARALRGGQDIVMEGGQYVARPALQPAKDMNFLTSVKANIPEDPETRRRLIAQSLFPNDPNGMNRVGFAEGAPVYLDERGELRRVSSPLTSFAANTVANAPEIAGSVLGSFATGNPVSGAALGAMGGRAAKRAASEFFFNEPATPGSVAREMATEGALNLATGGAAKLVGKFADRGRIVDFTPADIKTAEQARQYAKQTTGVDLDLAQASGDRKLIALRNYAARYPGKSAQVIQAADDAAQGQFESATKRVVDLVAKAEPSEVSGANAVNAARMAIDVLKKQRDVAVAPYYEAAYKNALSTDTVEALKADPVLNDAARKVVASPIYQRDLQGARPDSVKFWHYVKQNIDDQIEKNASEPNKVRILTGARRDLVQKLEAASPEYASANQYYGQVTRDSVEPLENSAVGTLARITDGKVATASAKIFSDPNVSADQIAMTKGVLSKQDPQAYRGLVRQWLGQKYDKAMKETQTGDVVNPAGKFRQAVFGTPEDQRKAKAMLPADAAQAFDDLMNVAEKMSSTPIRGSDTAFNQQITEQLKGRALAAMSWLISPRQQARTVAEQRALDSGIDALTEALLNPSKRAQLRQVARMAPSTHRMLLLSGLLTGQVGKVAATTNTNEDFAPTAIGSAAR